MSVSTAVKTTIEPTSGHVADAAVQTDITGSDIDNMEAKISELASRLYFQHITPQTASSCFDISDFQNDDDRVKYYTGLPNFKVLTTVFEFLHEYVKCGKSLSHFQEFVIVLAKLRLNLGLQDLAYRCNISIATVSRILRRWIIVMNARLTPSCIIWPEKYSILGGPLPVEFISKTLGDSEPLIDSMVRVCCCLSNLCDSVVPFS